MYFLASCGTTLAGGSARGQTQRSGDRRAMGQDRTAPPTTSAQPPWWPTVDQPSRGDRRHLVGAEDRPAEYPSPSTCWRRLKRWDEDGTWLRIWRAFIAELDARGRLQWETAFIDGTFASAKKGGPTSGLPSGGKVQSAWYWSSVRVFLWESPLPRRRPRKSRSSTRRLTRA